ncbi:MAG TPA: alginate lyase family protein [Bacteroidales bacterium]|nr:alginate lyase family protein [Bacteroidales bacterium]
MILKIALSVRPPFRIAVFMAFYLVVFNNALFAFEHPGGMHSKKQIEFVKKQIGQKNEPYYSAYRQLINFSDSALLEESHELADFSVPGYYVVPAEHIKNSLSLHDDSFNAYACALAWQLSGEKKYAERALFFINAWSSVNKSYSDADGPLVMSYTGTSMVMAAELMHNYPGWNKADKERFSVWLKSVYRKAANEIRNRKNNWADWGRFGSSLAAYYLDDMAEMKENIRLVKSDLFDKIADDGHMPEETRRGANGIWYTYFSLAPMTASIWVFNNAVGENLFVMRQGERSIKSALDYLLYYNQHPEKWAWFTNPNQGISQVNPSEGIFWPANLIEAMSGIYRDTDYIKYSLPYRPLCYDKHHGAWVFSTLMPSMIDGYKKSNSFLYREFCNAK